MATNASRAIASGLRAELARRQISQEELGAQLSISQAAVSRRLTGHIAFDIDELEAVAALFGTPLNQLLATLLSSAPDLKAAS